jgi:hypothetical protein
LNGWVGFFLSFFWGADRLLLTGGLGKTLITPLSTFTRDAAPKRRLAPQPDWATCSSPDDSTSHSVWSSWK